MLRGALWLAVVFVLLTVRPAHASLDVATTVSPTVATQGASTTLNYLVTVTNTSSFASAVTLTDTLPAYTTYVAGTTSVRINGALVSAANPTASGSPQVAVWTNGGTGFSLPTGGTLTLAFQAAIVSPVEGVFPNRVTVADIDGTLPNNAPVTIGPTALVTIGSPPVLAVGAAVSPGAVARLGTATYTVAIGNSGGASTSGLTIVDTLPPGFSYNVGSATWQGVAIGDPVIAGQTLTWRVSTTAGLSDVPSGSSRTLTFAVTAPNLDGTFDSTVAVSATNTLNVGTGPTATLQVGAGASIAVCKGAGASGTSPACGSGYTASAGGAFRYMITITNTGATTVPITDVIDNRPADTNFTIGSAQVSINGGAFTALQDPTIVGDVMRWSGGPFFPYSLPVGQTLRIRWDHSAPAARSGTFNNQVTVLTSNTAATSTGPTASLTVSGPVYGITKTVLSPSPATLGVAGGTVTYEITVTNAGTVTGQATLTDTFATGWSYVNGTSQFARNGGGFSLALLTPNPGGTNPTRRWTVDDRLLSSYVQVPAGGNVRLRFQVSVPAGFAPGTYPDVATVTDAAFTDDPAVSTGDTAPVTVVAGPQVGIDKTVSPATVLSLQTVVYKVHVTNASTATASATLAGIADALPANFTYQPGTAAISSNNVAYSPFQDPVGTTGTIRWSGAPGFALTLAAGEERWLRFTVQVGLNPGTYANVATVLGANFADVGTGPTATVSVGDPPRISVCEGAATPVNTPASCGAGAAVPAGGGSVAYTITISNTGAAAGTNVAVQDALPAGFACIAGSSQLAVNGGAFAATGDPSASAGTITWSGPFTVPAGGTLRLRFNATTATTAGSYASEAFVVGDNFSQGRSGTTAVVTVGAPPAISLPGAPSAVVTPASGTASFVAQYTFPIANAAGAGTANGGAFAATLPQYLSLVAGSSRYSTNGGASWTSMSNPLQSTGTVTWTGLPNLVANATLLVRFSVAVDAAAPTGTYFVETSTWGANYAPVTSGGPPSASNAIPALTVTGASAVRLQELTATSEDGQVVVQWRVGSALGNDGFHLYRSDSPSDRRTRLNAGLIAGTGTAGADGAYRVHDDTALAGHTYCYWLEEVGFAGVATLYGPVTLTVPAAGGTATATLPSTPPTGPADAWAVPSERPDDRPGRDQLQILHQDDRSIEVRLTTPPAQVQTVDGVRSIVIPGLPVFGGPGQPSLPRAVVPIGLPPGVPYRLEVLDAGEPLTLSDRTVTDLLSSSAVSGPASRLPTGSPATPSALPSQGVPAPATTAAGTPAGGGLAGLRGTLSGSHLQLAFGVLGGQEPYPPRLAALEGQADLRRLQIGQLQLYPVQLDASGERLVQYRRLQVRLTFDGPTRLAPPLGTTPWDRALAALTQEYGLLQRWQTDERPEVDAFQRGSGAQVRLTVTQSGMQRVPAERLRQAGMDLAEPQRLQLRCRDQEVPLALEWADGALTALSFYCASPRSPYADHAVYRLVVGDQPGRRMAVTDLTPSPLAPLTERCRATVHREENHLYWANKPRDEFPDHWYWDTVSQRQNERAFRFVAGAVAAGDALSGKLRIGLRGTLPDPTGKAYQHVQVRLNQTPIADLRWPGNSYLDTTVGFANVLLQDGANVLSLVVVDDTGQPDAVVYLDRFDVTYWRRPEADPTGIDGRFEQATPQRWRLSGFQEVPLVFDLTDDQAPMVGHGAAFAGTALTLGATDGRFSHRFLACEPGGLPQPLVTPWTFDDDLHAPGAGADYLVLTTAALRPAAERLVLHRATQGLQGRVVDLADVYAEFAGGQPEPQAIRAFLRWAVANWPAPKPSYVVLLGDGHFDYRNDFGTSPPEVVPPLLRDNPQIGTIADENGFAALTDTDPLPDLFLGRLPVTNLAEADAVVDKLVHYDLQPAEDWLHRALAVSDDDDPTFTGFAQAMATSHAGAFGWHAVGIGDGTMRSLMQQGNGLTLYVGHGYVEGWAREEALTIYRSGSGSNDLDGFAADDHTGLMVTANCLNGYFHDPDYPCLGEVWLRTPHKGAIAFWGTSGYSVPSAQFVITRRFFQYLLDQDLDVGTAGTLAKISLYLDGCAAWREEVAAWVLLGDPATHVRH